jgi:riboflavin kinase/FMN adenylyltransferase
MAGSPQAPSVVTLGNYDGVHLGHRALVARAKQRADAQPGLRAVALTFDPHPLRVLSPQHAPPLLTTLERRIALLRGAGADEVVVQPFDAAFASWAPEIFVRALLVERLAASRVVIGHDFRFGRNREGDLSTLRSLGEHHGFEVETVAAVVVEGTIVSSSTIREAVAAGDLARATALLGRVHEVEGQVVQGDQRGRALGFPTANLHVDGVLMPPDGVYAVVVRVLDAAPDGADAPREAVRPGAAEVSASAEDRDGSRATLLRGVANLGVRPTFGAGRTLEVHVLDVQRALYGARLRVGFVERLRDEQRFPNADALRNQIGRDVERARRSLSDASPEILRWI